MPNVEMFGIPDYEIKQIRHIVKKVMKKSELRDFVFTDHEADVSYIDENPAPFIRITDTNKKRALKLAKLFPNYDVEIMILYKFIPEKT